MPRVTRHHVEAPFEGGLDFHAERAMRAANAFSQEVEDAAVDVGDDPAEHEQVRVSDHTMSPTDSLDLDPDADGPAPKQQDVEPDTASETPPEDERDVPKQRGAASRSSRKKTASNPPKPQFPLQIAVSGAGNREVNGSYALRQTLPKDAEEAQDPGFPLYQHMNKRWLWIARFGGTWWIGHFRPATRDFYRSESSATNPTAIKRWVAVKDATDRAAQGKSPVPVLT